MLGLLSSQLAFSAATTLAKKTFEFSITSSLKGLSDVIRERFSNSQVLQDTQAELEAKVKMLCLPVDLLAHYATRGNTALQEPLGVALGVLEEVEAFRQALVQQHVTRAQDGGTCSPDAATSSAAQLTRRLRELIARLDSLLPYLNLAITTATLLNQGSPSPVSYSRLMAASWHLRSNPQPGAAVFALPEACWHEERQLTAAGPRMGEVFPRCSLTICRAGGSSSGSAGGGTGQTAAAAAGARAAAAAASARSEAAARLPPLPAASNGGGGGYEERGWFGYELVVDQDLDDGLHHEDEEVPGTLRLQVADIVALEWETTQSLSQGENEYRPALVLHIWQGGGINGSSSGGGGTGGPLQSAVRAGAGAGDEGGLATPPAGSAARPASSASSRRGGAATGRPHAGAVGAEDLAAAPGTAGAAVGMVTPVAAARAGSSSGVGGSIRRCAVICNLQAPGDDDKEAAEAEDGRGSSGSEEEEEGDVVQQRRRGRHRRSPSGSDREEEERGRQRGQGGRAAAGRGTARQGGGLPGRGAGAEGSSFAGAAPVPRLQREWQLLGELEFVLRLCILECREQAPHYAVTDERIMMSFQATCAYAAPAVPAGTATSLRTAPPAPISALEDGARDSTVPQLRSGGGAAAAAAARWRSAAAGAAHAIGAGVEAVTAGVRQLSFTPGAGSGGQGGPAAAAEAFSAAAAPSSSGPEQGRSGARQTRSSSRQGGRGFGSPVQ